MAEQEEDLQCSICIELYSDDRQPIHLPCCKQLFCSRCHSQICESSKWECPGCRKRITRKTKKTVDEDVLRRAKAWAATREQGGEGDGGAAAAAVALSLHADTNYKPGDIKRELEEQQRQAQERREADERMRVDQLVGAEGSADVQQRLLEKLEEEREAERRDRELAEQLQQEAAAAAAADQKQREEQEKKDAEMARQLADAAKKPAPSPAPPKPPSLFAAAKPPGAVQTPSPFAAGGAGAAAERERRESQERGDAEMARRLDDGDRKAAPVSAPKPPPPFAVAKPAGAVGAVKTPPPFAAAPRPESGAAGQERERQEREDADMARRLQDSDRKAALSPVRHPPPPFSAARPMAQFLLEHSKAPLPFPGVATAAQGGGGAAAAAALHASGGNEVEFIETAAAQILKRPPGVGGGGASLGAKRQRLLSSGGSSGGGARQGKSPDIRASFGGGKACVGARMAAPSVRRGTAPEVVVLDVDALPSPERAGAAVSPQVVVIND